MQIKLRPKTQSSRENGDWDGHRDARKDLTHPAFGGRLGRRAITADELEAELIHVRLLSEIEESAQIPGALVLAKVNFLCPNRGHVHLLAAMEQKPFLRLDRALTIP